jgi:hypothetical protein
LFSDWQTLLSLQAGAAATLTGLVFVAASINLTKIVATPLLTVRVVESLVQFLQVFFVCSVMIVPHQSSFVLAIEILAVIFILMGDADPGLHPVPPGTLGQSSLVAGAAPGG